MKILMYLFAIVTTMVICTACGDSVGGNNTLTNENIKDDIRDLDSLCSEHFGFGQPAMSAYIVPLCHHDFFIAYDVLHKIPLFTAHELTVYEAQTYIDRKYNFRTDNALSQNFEQSGDNDYYASGFDRGHYVPWGDTGNYLDAEDTNIYTNVAPMRPNFNRVTWLAFENSIREYVIYYGADVYIIMGGIINNQTAEIIGDQVAVPESFYKIILDKTNEKLFAFIINHEEPSSLSTVEDYKITVEDLESKIGVNLFPYLTSEKKKKMQKSDGVKGILNNFNDKNI